MASSGRLKPGEKGKLRMTVDIKGKTGPMVKTAHVYSNDPKIPDAVLTISMEIYSPTAWLLRDPNTPALAAH